MAERRIGARPVRPPAPRMRRDFSRIPDVIAIPNLLEMQQHSYEQFLQIDMLPDEREEMGMQAIFKNVFPITNFNKTASLEFVSYELGTWECHCGTLQKMENRYAWRCPCGQHQGVSALPEEGEICPECGRPAEYIICPHCEKRVSLKMKYAVEECRERGLTFSAPLKVRVRLVVWDKETDSEEREIRDIKEEEVYLGELPIMTDAVEHPDGRISVGSKGIFIINGTERVIVSQMHRSPGVFFKHDMAKHQATGKLLYSARLIPYRGSWIEFEFDTNDILHVKIDRKRKLLATVLLRALGYTENQEILRMFYSTEQLTKSPDGWLRNLDRWIIGDRALYDLKHPETGEVIAAEDEKINKRLYKKLKEAGIEEILYGVDRLAGRVVVDDVVDEDGVVILECNSEITHENAPLVHEVVEGSLEVIFLESSEIGGVLHETLLKDKLHQSPDPQRDAQVEIYKRLRPGDPLTPESAQRLFERYFFDPKNYDLSQVGRLKVNKKLGLDAPLDVTILRPEDVSAVVRYLLQLRYGRGSVDDIDHLGNRRVRCVGELLQNHLRIGLVRMERAVRERMSIQDMATSVPHELINAKPVTAALNEFFGSSQLSQFMDQNNPLAELTHKRRLSALGPGGLSRERAGFEVRDVHTTHYGRICPIETPEGPNVGLIVSLSTYARVTGYGFIETPYRRVQDTRVCGEIEYLTALDEDAEIGPEGRKYIIAQANSPFDPETGKLLEDRVAVRSGSDFMMAPSDQVDYMDVSPRQLVSVSTALVPFLENDDANRALMGSNMQRQAVPLLQTEAPLVGTGMEYVAAYDSGAVLAARRGGVVESVGADRIIIRADAESGREGTFFAESNIDIYKLTKFQRSNQGTCTNQKPLVRRGQRVEAGEVIADGPATDHGDLALGRNILVAFMPWAGYNFEDAILISERLVKEDSFTSVHIEVFETEARDTKLGKEEITRDIPNVSEENLRNLDASGIIRIGADVRTGDVLVGKITPKGETQLTPEEKLLRAIFGEKAGDVRDASLTVPPGVEGTVIDVKVFSRRGAPKDSRSEEILEEKLTRIRKDFEDERELIREEAARKQRALLTGQTTTERLEDPGSGELLLKKRQKMTPELLDAVPEALLDEIQIGKDAVIERLSELRHKMEEQIEIVRKLHQEREERLQKGDELSPGVIKMVKVFLAVKRKLQVGDKMAGRHGNKGVISKIVPEAEMPFMPDGTPVDIVLNPLGVPSRMNVGQILETKLGWAAFGLGRRLFEMAEQMGPDGDPQALRELFSAAYPREEDRAAFAEMDGPALRRFALGLARGMPVATPVFDGAAEDSVDQMLDMAGLPRTGKTALRDGRTGLPFDQEITVGMIYMLKLHHLVDEKIHARSIGPYSLVTQQPLGGRAQFGGQRFGEMEVWALEAYGAAHTLQELLTVKSDDVLGRTRVYQAIVKNETMQEPGIPESFNVLVKELQSLALDVELIDSAKTARRAGDRLMAL